MVIKGRKLRKRPPGNGGLPQKSAPRRVPGSHTQTGLGDYCCFCLLFFPYLTEATKLLRVHSWHFHHMPLAGPWFHSGLAWWC